jgi:DNA-binding NarL/FixJ family response regulator
MHEILEVLQLLYSSIPECEIISTATCIEDAKRILREEPFDLISIDLCLGPDDGFDLCEYVGHTYPHIFMVVCSADNTQENKEKATGFGVRYFLPKPVDVKDLLEVCETAQSEMPKIQRPKGTPDSFGT